MPRVPATPSGEGGESKVLAYAHSRVAMWGCYTNAAGGLVRRNDGAKGPNRSERAEIERERGAQA